MQRRDFMKLAGLTMASQAVPPAQAEETVAKPNLILIIADQRHYGVSKANGYPFTKIPGSGRVNANREATLPASRIPAKRADSIGATAASRSGVWRRGGRWRSGQSHPFPSVGVRNLLF